MHIALKETLLIAAGFLAASAATAARQEIKPDQIVTYKKIHDTKLKLHIFYPPGHKSSDKTPAIVFFFGGGWVSGSPTQFYHQCRYLASRGMVAISAEYRVKKRNGTTPRECVMDGKSAVRWIRRHASELGVDPNRLAAGGGSAGGHVALATALVKDMEEQNEDKSVSCRPNALVLFNPVIDTSPDGFGYRRVQKYWREISPLHNIGKNAPPMIIFLGTEDRIIPVATAKKFQKQVQEHGGRCDLRLYEGQGHGFFNYRPKNPKYYVETMIEADKFLESLGYLKGPPTIEKRGVAPVRNQ